MKLFLTHENSASEYRYAIKLIIDVIWFYMLKDVTTITFRATLSLNQENEKLNTCYCSVKWKNSFAGDVPPRAIVFHPEFNIISTVESTKKRKARAAVGAESPRAPHAYPCTILSSRL